ncbi:MAG TPA: zinc-binding alcohol dehydrogenase [Clostridiales bacterium]|nr:zinc-binding alcohol dehydrogenase [Clostridiales bacterium]
MKTIYAVAEHGRVILKEKELPKPGPGELLLEAEYSTMSPGTEHTLMAGSIVPLPTNIGYSMAARVLEAGEGVTDFKVGDPVVTTGEHAQYLIMDQYNVTPAPEGIDLEQAAFFNLGHTGMYAVRRAQLQLGEPVVVLGQGFVGAITAQVAKAAGALPVIVADLEESRLDIAREMGVHYAVNTGKDPEGLTKVIKSLKREGVPVVFEATGVRQPLEQAFEIVAERGRVIMISQVHGDEVPKYDQNLMMKGASLIGTYVNSKPFALRRADLKIQGGWPPVMDSNLVRYVNSDSWTSDEDIRVFLNLIYYGNLNIKPLISHRFTYGQIPEAYELVWNQDPGLLGGVIRWKK